METAIVVALITTAGTIIVAIITLVPRLLDAREKRQSSPSISQALAQTVESTTTNAPRQQNPPLATLPTGQIRLFGTSASERRTPREMDLQLDGDEIRIDIHNPGMSQWVFWLARNDLSTVLRGANWRRPLEITLPARKAGSTLDVILKIYHAEDDELEVQTGKWWMWLKTNDLLGALRQLDIKLD